MRKRKSKQSNGVPRGRKVAVEKFVLQAIERLRTPGQRGIHTVFTGFNAAFRTYYGSGADPVKETKKLVEKGVIALRLAKGGAIIYRAEDAPKSLAAGRRIPPEEVLQLIVR